MNLNLKVIGVNSILTCLLLDFVLGFFLKEKVQKIYPEYLKEAQTFGRGYPKGHFNSDKLKGFDIKKNSKKVMSNLPKEINPYPVWGNNIGCFDHGKNKNDKYEIYLAGDSYTWGYAPIENKFGTIIEEKTGLNVAACGVSHTGQIHQFQKFKEIVETLKYFPKYVIVNREINDIDNDYFHPHTTIIDGYQIDDVRVIVNNKDIYFEKITFEELRENLDYMISKGSNYALGRFDPRKYSLTAVILIEYLYKPLKNLGNKKVSKCSFKNTGIYYFSNCFPKQLSKYDLNIKILKPNKSVILEWIKHSKENNYKLIFSDISISSYALTEDGKEIFSSKFCDFIKSNGVACIEFGNYLRNNLISTNKITWKKDFHFNFYGNELYADYLIKFALKEHF